MLFIVTAVALLLAFSWRPTRRFLAFQTLDRHRPETVSTLLDIGLDPNGCNSDSWSMLVTAIVEQCPDLAQDLIRSGADVYWNSAVGGPPLFHAMTFEQVDVVHALLENGADIILGHWSGVSPLMGAVTASDETRFKLLVQRGADVNASNIFGKTALIRACELNEAELARMLILRGEM